MNKYYSFGLVVGIQFVFPYPQKSSEQNLPVTVSEFIIIYLSFILFYIIIIIRTSPPFSVIPYTRLCPYIGFEGFHLFGFALQFCFYV